MFRPCMSSGCDWTIGSVILECVQRSWGVLGERGGSRSHYNSGYPIFCNHVCTYTIILA